MFFCIEILGESAFHKFLVQSGWSGRDYLFHYNRHTNSHMRAYRNLQDYYSERLDLHKSASIWPLLGNVFASDQIEEHVFTDSGKNMAKPTVELVVDTSFASGEALPCESAAVPKLISASPKRGHGGKIEEVADCENSSQHGARYASSVDFPGKVSNQTTGQPTNEPHIPCP